MKIQVYAPDMYAAGRLAATMNLSLRHWQYAGEHRLGLWADVGSVMDDYEDLERELGLPPFGPLDDR